VRAANGLPTRVNFVAVGQLATGNRAVQIPGDTRAPTGASIDTIRPIAAKNSRPERAETPRDSCDAPSTRASRGGDRSDDFRFDRFVAPTAGSRRSSGRA
jgi:hypothetical protein